jgi:hypothetical protein
MKFGLRQSLFRGPGRPRHLEEAVEGFSIFRGRQFMFFAIKRIISLSVSADKEIKSLDVFEHGEAA